jgi:hypothetical protein
VPDSTPSAGPLPRPYLAWLAAVTAGRLGDAVLGFGLGWAASGHGGTAAALVLTVGAAPRLVLLVLGGAVADRFGARRIVIGGEAALLVLTVALAVLLARFGSPTWLLLTSSLALGAVAAFCLPASGSMPRRLVPDDQLVRALALRQGSSQTVQMLAAPLGGVLVATAGLTAVAWGDAVALAAGLCVLVAVRELSGPGSPGTAPRPPRLDLADGVRVVARTPGLGAALALTGASAALMLPVPSLLVPLLGRASGWGAGVTGTVAGAVGVGVIGASLLAARRGRRSSGPGAERAGFVLSAAGAAVLALAHPVGPTAGAVAAAVGAVTFGLGNGVVVARLAPLVLGSAPRTHLARVQALVGLVQLVPVMVANTALGALAQHASPGAALAATAAGLGACAAWAGRGALDPHVGRGVTVSR